MPLLLESGVAVRAIARSPEKLAAHPNLEIVRGSTDDADVLTRAFVGAQAVFWCVPSPMKAPDVAAHYARFAGAAAVALHNLDAQPKMVTVSTSSIPDNAAPHGAATVYQGLRAMEETINATGAPACHLRNGFFMDNLLSAIPRLKKDGILSFPMPADHPLAMVASADIARIAAQEMTSDAAHQTHRVLSAGRYNMNQLASLISQGTGHEILYQRADEAATRALLLQHGASPDFVESYIAMSQSPSDAESVEGGQTDAEMITLKEFVQQKIVPTL